MSVAASSDLPVLIDPFSRLGDEIAGDSPEKIALNFAAVVRFSRGRNQPLLHPAPNLRRVFRGHKLSEEAKSALRRAEADLKGIRIK